MTTITRLAAVAALAAWMGEARAITYELASTDITFLGLGTFDLSGTIETDGMLGPLTEANITRGMAVATPRAGGTAITLTVDPVMATSLSFSRVEVTASPSALTVDFEVGGEIRFEALGGAAFGFRQSSIIPFVEAPGLITTAVTPISDTNSGVIAAVVPLPAGLPLLLTGGLAAVAVMARRRA